MDVLERNQSFYAFHSFFCRTCPQMAFFTVATYVTRILAQSQGRRGLANDVIGTQKRAKLLMLIWAQFMNGGRGR